MSGWMCDACRRSVYRASDGYFCCLAPGMGRITASHKKPVGGSCRFYEARADMDPWTLAELRAWCESLGYGFEAADGGRMQAGDLKTGRITCKLSRFAESLGGAQGIDVSGDRRGAHMDGECELHSNAAMAEAHVGRLARMYGIEGRGAQLSLDLGGAL